MQLGNPDAFHNLGLLNLEGKMDNFKPNHVYAFNKFLQAAQSGHVESAWHIVNYYLNGIERALPKVRDQRTARSNRQFPHVIHWTYEP